MNSTQQQCFLLAAQHKNFTKAAKELYITQPALSRNISALDDELELLLFTRNNNVLQITPGGRLLYDWMRQTSEDFSHVLEAARRANSEPDQPLRIGFVKSERPDIDTARAICTLSEREPELEIIITHHSSMHIIKNLEEHSMDIAVMVNSATRGHPRLITRKLSSIRRCIAVSIKHPLAKRKMVSISELRWETFISVIPQASPTLSNMVQRVCGMAGFTPMILEASGTDEQLEWIESGKGVGLLVDNHAQRYNPLLSFIDLEEEMPVELVCVWDRLNTNPHIPKFIDAFEEERSLPVIVDP